MIADKVELADPVGRRELQGFDHVDLVVDQAQSTNIAHIGKHTGTYRPQVTFLDAQQLFPDTKKYKFTLLTSG